MKHLASRRVMSLTSNAARIAAVMIDRFTPNVVA